MGLLLKCTIDPVCYWFELPFIAQLLIIGAFVLLIGGALFNLTLIAKTIAGWPGVAAVGALLLAVVAALTFKKPPMKAPRAPEGPSSVAPKPPKRKPRTLVDLFRNGRK